MNRGSLNETSAVFFNPPRHGAMADVPRPDVPITSLSIGTISGGTPFTPEESPGYSAMADGNEKSIGLYARS